MKNHKEFMQALLDGYTLIDPNGGKIKLNKDGMVGDMNGWLTPNGVGNYKWFEIYTPMATPEEFAGFSIPGSHDNLSRMNLPNNLGETHADNFKKFKTEKTYLTSADSNLRPILDRVAKFIDKLRGV